MLCKYYLQLGCYTLDAESDTCMDVSQMIANINNIKVSYSRVDLGGVVRKCGSSLEFTGKAKDAIIAHWEENYLQSTGVFAVFLADNNWEYTKAWECPLDFCTLQYDANVASIGCVDNSAAAVIKANKKSIYELDVSSIKDTYNLLYNGVVTRRQLSFNVVGATPEGEVTTDMVSSREITVGKKGYYSLYIPAIGVSTEDFSSDKITCLTQNEVNVHQFSDVGKDDGHLMNHAMEAGNAGFISCLSDCTIRVDMDIQFTSIYSSWWSAISNNLKAYFILVIGDTVVWRKEVDDFSSCDVSIHGDFTMVAGQKMAFALSVLSNCRYSSWDGWRLPDGSYNTDNAYLTFNPGLRWGSNTNTAYVNESQYDDDPIEIAVVKPINLLQNILDKMFASREDVYVRGLIDEGESLLPRTLLMAAESIRRITTNKIYSSFSDFCDFMESVFGYVYTIDELGYYMDDELAEIDSGDRLRVKHIKKSYLTSEPMSTITQEGYNKMLPIGGIISTTVDNIDRVNQLIYEWQYGQGVNFMEEVFYYEPDNCFIIQDQATQTWHTKWIRNDAVTQASWYNDSNDHAYEMLGLNVGTFINSQNGLYMFAIIRNGGIVLCDEMHTSRWLDSKENNEKVVELTFRHRSDVFSTDVMTLKSVNNLSYRLDESKVFSDLEVGYAKQDYDNNNSAKDEFNFTNYYKTDCDLNEQTLSLICPYRADCYGIEELLNKSTNEESTESDSDVFIVIASASEPVDGNWQIDRTISVENAYTNTVFNAAIAPNLIVLNNDKYIGSFAKKLKFTSASGNSSAVIGSRSMSASINITNQLFKVGVITVDTKDHNLPEDWNGVIEFEYNGRTYQGYLDSVDINFANLGTLKYNIIEKCIE